MIVGAVPQLSVADAVPVRAGVATVEHDTVVFCGQVIVGSVLSDTITIWVFSVA